MSDEKYIEYLEKKINKVSQEKQDKYYNIFAKQARFLGNGVYTWMNFYSNDTRELLLMGICLLENIKIKNK